MVFVIEGFACLQARVLRSWISGPNFARCYGGYVRSTERSVQPGVVQRYESAFQASMALQIDVAIYIDMQDACLSCRLQQRSLSSLMIQRDKKNNSRIERLATEG